MNHYVYRDTNKGRWISPEVDTRPVVFEIKTNLMSLADNAFEKEIGKAPRTMNHIACCVKVLKTKKVKEEDPTWGGAKVW